MKLIEAKVFKPGEHEFYPKNAQTVIYYNAKQKAHARRVPDMDLYVYLTDTDPRGKVNGEYIPIDIYGFSFCDSIEEFSNTEKHIAELCRSIKKFCDWTVEWEHKIDVFNRMKGDINSFYLNQVILNEIIPPIVEKDPDLKYIILSLTPVEIKKAGELSISDERKRDNFDNFKFDSINVFGYTFHIPKPETNYKLTLSKGSRKGYVSEIDGSVPDFHFLYSTLTYIPDGGTFDDNIMITKEISDKFPDMKITEIFDKFIEEFNKQVAALFEVKEV